MSTKYIGANALRYIISKCKAAFAPINHPHAQSDVTGLSDALGGKVDKVTGKGLSTNDYTTAEKTKLSGVATGANAYVHPTHTAKSSGLYKVTVDGTGHVSAATAVAKSDITALGIPAQDTVYTHPTTAGNKHVPSGGASGQILRWSADGTAVWGADNNTTYSVATASVNGLMAAADKSKLDSIAAGAQVNTLTGVKGNAESSYRVGNVNITPANIGLGSVNNTADSAKNVLSATKLTTARTISLTGDATGGASFDGSANATIEVTVGDDSHDHSPGTLSCGTYSQAGGLDPLTRQSIGAARSNKSFGLRANAIEIEYSRDGGVTWTDYGATDAQKMDLFAETRKSTFYLGESSDKTHTTAYQLRVTITPTDRYVSFDGFYCWMSTNGNTTFVTLEYSTVDAPTTFATVFSGKQLSGWSGNNIVYFPSKTFGGGRSTNGYRYRMTFYMNSVNNVSSAACIYDIRFLGVNVWSHPNAMVLKDRLYTWDSSLNATFPARLTATSFTGNLTGNATTATKLATPRTINGVAFDGTANISVLGETSATAYRGDRGKIAYDHSQAAHQPLTQNLTAEASLADADVVSGYDASATAARKFTFTAIKAFLKTYFDTLYNKYVHPTYTARSAGLYKVTVDGTGHVSAVTAVAKADITALGIPAQDTVYTHPTTTGNKHVPSGGASGQILRWSADGTAAWGADNNTTYAVATQSANGLMAAADKTKLDGVATGANNYTHPNSGATAGTYRSVTVDAAGHVTAGSNPTVTVAQGGTGATTVAAARNALGLGNTAGAVPVANGGTGATNAATARTNLGAAAASVSSEGNLSTTWTGTEAPFTQTVNVTGVTATNNIMVSIGSSATPEQMEAWGAGQIMATGQGAGTVTFTAMGTAPEIAIPYVVVILG